MCYIKIVKHLTSDRRGKYRYNIICEAFRDITSNEFKKENNFNELSFFLFLFLFFL